jgi:predicted RNA binding protein YcfA (HicA-like mRNA interferase family)
MKALSGKEFIKVLEKKGWVLQRIRGSHHLFSKIGQTEIISIPVS